VLAGLNRERPDLSDRALATELARSASSSAVMGTLFMRSGRHDEAVVAYRQSLRYRPNYPATYLNLGYALKDCGRLEAAAGAWELATRLAPQSPAPRQGLSRLGRAVGPPQ
jgi:tetratricopeptide (TPR) repeat protein